ncbi:MAG: DUF983 domain-containing protein [Rhizobiaceae bacterium]
MDRFETGVKYGEESRPVLRSMLRGASCHCPNCGSGSLFKGFLTTPAKCETCGEQLDHHRADDLPAYLNIFVTGHLVVGVMLMLMVLVDIPMWPMTFATAGAALVFSFATMRPIKGAVIGCQWALRMHGFGGHED